MNDIGVVAIGRNEGERLRRCLASVVGRGMPGRLRRFGFDRRQRRRSPESMGAEVVELDMSHRRSPPPGRATRAFERLACSLRRREYVQFVDGDCEVVDGWIEPRRSGARRPPRRRSRLRPAARAISPTLRSTTAWPTWSGTRPIGEAKSCGGDAMMRVEAFQQVGGFDPTVVAGEEPELCRRLRAAGWKILRIDAEMTRHDAAMTRFAQWWNRQVRSGYGAIDVATRFADEADPLFARQVRSAQRWTIGFTALLVLVCAVGLCLGGRHRAWAGAVGVALVLAIWMFQVLRVAVHGFRRSPNLKTAVAFGVLTMMGKWGFMVGRRKYFRRPSRRANDPADRLQDGRRPRAGPSMKDLDFQADLARYPDRPFFREQSIWAIWVYRFGRRTDRRKPGLVRGSKTECTGFYTGSPKPSTGISIPKSVEVGPGLRIHHFGNIFVHKDVKIGANCTLRQGVTIGNRHEGGPVPVLEDDVELAPTRKFSAACGSVAGRRSER